MFRFQPDRYQAEAIGRRAGRIAFGSVLIVVACWLVQAGLTGRLEHTPEVFGGMWLAAFAAAGIARICAARYRRRGVRDLLVPSLVVPSVGLALVLPLTIHLAFMHGKDFDEWVSLSMTAVGLSHVVFAIAAGMRAYRLARGEEPLSVATIYGLCVVCAAAPFGMFVVPIVLVAITGLPILPLLYYMQTVAERERAVVTLPHAVRVA